jgi:ATP-dependent DNA ligase
MLKSPFEPCIPTKAAKVPDRPEWIHEIKHDGYRLIVQRDGKRVRLWTALFGHAVATRRCPLMRVKRRPGS